jgi:hypothetical protein
LSRQDGTKHRSSTLDKLPSRPASSPAGFFLLSNIALIAVTCRTGSAESTPRRAFLRTKESDDLVANKALASDGQSNRQSQTKQ